MSHSRLERLALSLSIVTATVLQSAAACAATADPAAEIRALTARAAAEPASADAQRALALALRDFAQRPAAIRAARAAAAADPKSVPAQALLGDLLAHDVFGRLVPGGPDAAEAIRVLEPVASADAAAAVLRATLLQYNTHGVRFGFLAPVDQAVGALALARRAAPSAELDAALAEALVVANDAAGLDTVEPPLPHTPLLDGWRIAARAIGAGGVPDARAALDRIDAAARPATRAGAVLALTLRRRHDLARGVASDAAGAALGAPFPAAWEPLLATIDYAAPEGDAARAMARRYVTALLAGDIRELWSLFPRPMWIKDYEADAEVLGLERDALDAGQGLAVRDAAFACDLFHAKHPSSDDVAGEVHRIRFARGAARPLTVFVGPVDGTLRVLGHAGNVALLAPFVRARLDAGDAAGARTLLEWAVDASAPLPTAETIEDSPFVRLWKTLDPTPAENLRLAYAALDPSGANLDLLRAADRNAGRDEPLDVILMGAAQPYQARIEFAEKLLARNPEWQDPYNFLVAQFVMPPRASKATVERLGRAWIEKSPGYVTAREALYVIADDAKDAKAAEAQLDGLATARPGMPQVGAWLALHALRTGKGHARAAEFLLAGKPPAGREGDRAALLACLDADEGRLREAVARLRAASVERDGQPVPFAQYALARIAERLDLLQDALPGFQGAVSSALLRGRRPYDKSFGPLDIDVLSESRALDLIKTHPSLNYDPFIVSGKIAAPELKKRVDPVYPEDARLARVEGKVIAQLVIDEEGNVASVKILRSHPQLDDAAIAAVRQWKYKPARLDGRPVKVYFTAILTFKLQ